MLSDRNPEGLVSKGNKAARSPGVNYGRTHKLLDSNHEVRVSEITSQQLEEAGGSYILWDSNREVLVREGEQWSKKPADQ